LLAALAKDLYWQAHHNGSATDFELHKWWRRVGRWTTTLANVVLFAIIAVPFFLAAAISGHTALELCGIFLLWMGLNEVRSPIPRRIKVRHLTTREGLQLITFALLIFTLAGLVVGLGIGLIYRQSVGPVLGSIAGLVIGLAFGLVMGLLVDLDDTSPQAVGPLDVIRADGQFGLATGVVAGLAAGLAGGFVGGFVGGFRSGLVAGLAAGLAVGLLFGLGIGARAWVRYHIAVVIAAFPPRSGPLRFGSSLDWACRAGLLRLSGVAYQFRHRQLQDWLMSHSGGRAGEQHISPGDPPQS
jgi:hypothetical protein